MLREHHLGAKGLMPAELVLVPAERKPIDRAGKLIVLAPRSKFEPRRVSSFVICPSSTPSSPMQALASLR